MMSGAIQWNPIAQRVLAQSGNIAYAGRGIFRVSETQPSRKGDYWFRDFGMVMACTYMTEAGFRAVERYYTAPLLTKALNLHALAGQKQVVPAPGEIETRLHGVNRYPNAFNYSELPERLRDRLMGTVITDSVETVPQVLRQALLDDIQDPDASYAKDPGLKDTLEQLIKNPQSAENETKIQSFLAKNQLTRHRDALTAIVQIDNQARQQEAIQAFLKAQHIPQGESQKAVHNAIALLQNQQWGLLSDHLNRVLNYRNYLETVYFKPKPALKTENPHGFKLPYSLRSKNTYSPVSEMTEEVVKLMDFYVAKWHYLQNQWQSDLMAVAEKVRKLPQYQREKFFAEEMEKVTSCQFLYKKHSMTDIWRGQADEAKRTLEDLAKELNVYGNWDRKLSPENLENWKDVQGKCTFNWEVAFRDEREKLGRFLRERPTVTKNELDRALTGFKGIFKQMELGRDTKGRIGDKLALHLPDDVVMKVQKKIVGIFEAVCNLSDYEIPDELKSLSLREGKQRLMEASIHEFGIAEVYPSPPEYDWIKKISEDLSHLLPQKGKPGETRVDSAQHMTPALKTKVKNLVGAHFTGEKNAAGFLEGEYKNLHISQMAQDAKGAGKLKGRLHALLTTTEDEKKLVNSLQSLLEQTKDQKGLKEALANLLKDIKDKQLKKGVEVLLEGAKDEEALRKGAEDLLAGIKYQKALNNLMGRLLKPERIHPEGIEWTIKSLFQDGIQSRTVRSAVSKIQKNGTWPKMFLTVGLNFIFYGWLASRFDNKILQPYQEKLVAKKGTSQDIVTAGYLGLLPASLWLTQLWDKTSVAAIKKMNHFSRFTAVGGAALATFAGSTFQILKYLEKQPPKPGQVKLTSKQMPGPDLNPVQPAASTNNPFNTGSTWPSKPPVYQPFWSTPRLPFSPAPSALPYFRGNDAGSSQ